MSAPTPEQIAEAKLHATVWEEVARKMHANAESWDVKQRMNVDPAALRALGWLALSVGGSYRKIVNGSEIDD